MPEVTIDGITYTPNAAPTIGIGITTRNRPETLETTLQHIRKHTPNAHIVIVDDASTAPVPGADHRFTENVGIAQAKNKCLELLYNAGTEHMFLFDDDCYPITDNWWTGYIDSPEPHLMYIFHDLATDRKLNDIHIIYQDEQHIAYTGTRGCMLYVERRVLDVVGGMDPVFGKWGWEHPSWSGRINNAGLTTWRYADIANSEGLFYSLDEHQAVTAVDREVRTPELLDRNVELYRQLWRSAEYVEFREQRDVVITTLFTRQVDPQRGIHMKADPALLTDLIDSVEGADMVVLHDELDTADSGNTSFVKVDARMQPYFQRHISIWQYLREHPEIRYVWCVDGTDVEMLQQPWPHMKPGLLYLGSEPNVVGCQWMLDNHKADGLQEFMKANSDNQLLNAGLIGGDRATVMAFLHELTRLFFSNRLDVAHGVGEDLGVGDMAALNQVAWSSWAGRLVFGSRVNTVFKADERNDHSFFKHK